MKSHYSESSKNIWRLQEKKDSQILTLAIQARALLDRCKGDLDVWLAEQDLSLERLEFLLRPGSDGELLGRTIYVKKGLESKHEFICIAHELGHVLIHARCIGYRIADEVMVRKSEKEADTFASLILYPSLEEFETERDFILQCGLPKKTARLRINFFRRTGI